ncbi:PREDICTED: uncharacterized protein LOC108503161 [Lepidothrix coronata]|uniref:Uncharacterized protein LOC108503161 n=1 Tax=Lepidothrix coronata TaxID=321398 RepID=A0A6J0I6W5_9PASS|nr:PREDICTED: uncharacterized protein LOC108503161 [Lepidothrix coronata]
MPVGTGPFRAGHSPWGPAPGHRGRAVPPAGTPGPGTSSRGGLVGLGRTGGMDARVSCSTAGAPTPQRGLGTARAPAQLSSAQLGPAQLSSAEPSSARSSSAQDRTARHGPAQLSSSQPGLAQLGLARLSSAQSSLAQLGTVQFGSARHTLWEQDAWKLGWLSKELPPAVLGLSPTHLLLLCWAVTHSPPAILGLSPTHRTPTCVGRSGAAAFVSHGVQEIRDLSASPPSWPLPITTSFTSPFLRVPSVHLIPAALKSPRSVC